MDWGDDDEDWADFAAAPTDTQSSTQDFASTSIPDPSSHQEISVDAARHEELLLPNAQPSHNVEDQPVALDDSITEDPQPSSHPNPVVDVQPQAVVADEPQQIQQFRAEENEAQEPVAPNHSTSSEVEIQTQLPQNHAIEMDSSSDRVMVVDAPVEKPAEDPFEGLEGPPGEPVAEVEAQHANHQPTEAEPVQEPEGVHASEGKHEPLIEHATTAEPPSAAQLEVLQEHELAEPEPQPQPQVVQSAPDHVAEEPQVADSVIDRVEEPEAPAVEQKDVPLIELEGSLEQPQPQPQPQEDHFAGLDHHEEQHVTEAEPAPAIVAQVPEPVALVVEPPEDHAAAIDAPAEANHEIQTIPHTESPGEEVVPAQEPVAPAAAGAEDEWNDFEAPEPAKLEEPAGEVQIDIVAPLEPPHHDQTAEESPVAEPVHVVEVKATEPPTLEQTEPLHPAAQAAVEDEDEWNDFAENTQGHTEPTEPPMDHVVEIQKGPEEEPQGDDRPIVQEEAHGAGSADQAREPLPPAAQDDEDEWNDFEESGPAQFAEPVPVVIVQQEAIAISAAPAREPSPFAAGNEQELDLGGGDDDAWDDFESAAPLSASPVATHDEPRRQEHVDEFSPQFDNDLLPAQADEDDFGDEWNAFEGPSAVESQPTQPQATQAKQTDGDGFEFEADFGDFAAADSFAAEPSPAVDAPGKDEKSAVAFEGMAGIDGLEALARLVPDGWRRDFVLPLASLKTLSGRLFSAEEKLRPVEVLDALPPAASSSPWSADALCLLLPTPSTTAPAQCETSVEQLRLVLRASLPGDALSVEEVRTSFIRRDFSVTQEDRDLDRPDNSLAAAKEKSIALVSVPSMDRQQADSPRAPKAAKTSGAASSASPPAPATVPVPVAVPAANEAPAKREQPAPAASSKEPPRDDLDVEELSHAAVVFLRALPDFSFLLEQS